MELFTKSGLDKIGKDDLIALANERNVEIEDGAKKDDIVAAILVAQDNRPAPPDPAKGDGPKWRVKINSTEHDDGDVAIGVNGRVIQIQRDKEVDIPDAYMEVLRRSTVRTFRKDPDTGKESPVDIAQYHFTAEKLG